MAKLSPQDIAKLNATKEHQPAKGASQLAGFISDIKHLLVSPEYEYARATLEGILATVTRTEYVTPAQERAVYNITMAPSRGDDGHRSMKRRRWRE